MQNKTLLALVALILIGLGAWFFIFKERPEINSIPVGLETASSTDTAPDTTATTTTPATPKAVAPSKTTLKGYLIIGDNIQSFQPCGSQKKYWITGSATTVQLIIDTYRRAVPMKTNNPIYAELYGYTKNAPQNIINAGYSKYFDVSKIVKIAATGKCQ